MADMTDRGLREYSKLAARLAVCEKRGDALAKLREYVVHKRSCDAVSTLTPPHTDCSCGLSELLKDIGDATD